ncbi:phasin family protein [Ideonella sp. BN130291]|uniref:phasin family protein n=1 Tax=Ideonella sp. BN130291 TaxID=3112940 RepID=UPI002E26ADE4|nr:phasin family protein [Ideonella sp. BN130291]
MVKKLQKMAEKKTVSAAGLLDSQIAQTVKDSAQQIWLAGLGAFAKAQEEGGKVFEALVKEGVSLQRKTQAVAEERIGDVTGKMSNLAEGVTSKAGQQWDKLESIFEDRVSKALNKLGVPSSKDIDALVQRVDELSAQVAKLSKAPRAASTPAKPAAKANGVAKPAGKRAAARKSAAA